jgi:hypothetical protein
MIRPHKIVSYGTICYGRNHVSTADAFHHH